MKIMNLVKSKVGNAVAFVRDHKVTATVGALVLGGFSTYATDDAAVAVPFPEGVNPTGILSGMATTLAGVVAAALAIWAGFYLVKLAKRLLASHLK